MINYYGGFKVKIPVPDPSATRPLEGAGNYWKQAGDETKPGILQSIKYKNYYSYLEACDRFVANGAYLTIGDLTASYSFRNHKWLKESVLSNLEIRIQASNVYSIGFNRYHYSAATRNYAKKYLTPTYTFNINLSF